MFTLASLGLVLASATQLGRKPLPMARYHLALGVEIDGIFAGGMQIAVKRLFPSGKREPRYRRRYADIDSHHTRLDPHLEGTRHAAAGGTQHRGVTKARTVGHVDSIVKCGSLQHTKNR